MSVAARVERLIQVAREKDGRRLELVSGRPAVLITPEARLQAGRAVFAAADLLEWVQGAMPEGLLVAFELGEKVEFESRAGEGAVRVSVGRVGGAVQVRIDLDGGAAAPAPPPPGTGQADRPGEPAEPDGSAAAPRPASAAVERPLDRMLRELVERGGSDLHLTAACAPMMRLHGEMCPLPGVRVPLSSEHVLLMCDEVAPAANRAEFRSDNDTDFAYEIPSVARFRVNVFRDRRGVGAVFRQIPNRILGLEELGLPECVRTLCTLRKGLVLVTGPTGSGKSTTLAAMIDHINGTRSDHIITIEDPIEFVHENRGCLVNQREVHAHTGSFKRALRAALREDPDIVLVGELRDLETMGIAIETAETGHLVFGTLHTTSAVSTVDRLIDQFPADRQEQVRTMLAESLKGVIAQILVRKVDGGRVAAHEILLGVPAVANLIREGKTFQIPSVIQTGRRLGMRSMNDSLAELARSGVVDVEEALARSADRDALRGLLKLDEGGRGQQR